MEKLLIDCRRAHRLISQGRDARLPWAHRLALWWHLRICDACATVARNFAVLARAVRQMGRES